MNSKGFTMIEMIAVISILALITIIMVPTVTNISSSVKQKNYIALQNMIMNATIEYITNSSEKGYSLDDIKGEEDTCEIKNDEYKCFKKFTVGDILDKGIYVSNDYITISQDGEDKKVPTVYNPTNGYQMRDRSFYIIYDPENYSLYGVFSKGKNDK